MMLILALVPAGMPSVKPSLGIEAGMKVHARSIVLAPTSLTIMFANPGKNDISLRPLRLDPQDFMAVHVAIPGVGDRLVQLVPYPSVDVVTRPSLDTDCKGLGPTGIQVD